MAAGLFALQAIGGLLRRYGMVFRQAWRERQTTDIARRPAYEAQFLPTALALQETPISPLPRAAMGLLVAFSALALAWAILGRVDVVATAPGKLVPSGRSKTIQPLETATVKSIRVRDGQAVKAGEVLIELDPTSARADLDRLTSELAEARSQLLRGEALLAAIDAGKSPHLTRPAEMTSAAFHDASRLLTALYGDYAARLSHVDAEIAQREAELASAHEGIQKLALIVPLAKQRTDDFRRMALIHAASEHSYRESEQESITREGELAGQRSRAVEVQAAIVEGKARRAALVADARRSVLESINEGQQKRSALEQELLKAQSRDGLTRLISPVDGTVQQLAVFTVGGVVTPAQPVAIIVPSDNPLEVEALIENKDIGFVKTGQEAEVKIETFSFVRYGTLPARVMSVSHDAISDEEKGLVYSTRVKLDRTTILVDGTQVELGPGMAVSVEIKTGKRRVIEFFTSPFLQYGHDSLRER